MKNTPLFTLAVFIQLFTIAPAYACRYTVREIGFSELGAEPYQLYFYTNNAQPAERMTTIQNISSAALTDANISVKVINVDERPNDSAVTFLRSHQVDPLSHAILASPAGRSIVLPLDSESQSFKEAIWSVLEEMTFSPVRKKLLEKLVGNFAVVLLIEGTDSDQNSQALAHVNKAIREISKVTELMAKPVQVAPVLERLPQDERAGEKILLWSLGVDTLVNDAPYVAILYGRGRRMGPVLKGDQISENNMFSLMNLIGADCECGLDRSWMLGMMIPLRWDTGMQKKVSKHLKFDVENPLIKAEMAQILSIGSAGTGKAIPAGQAKNRLTGYNEEVVQVNGTIDIPRLDLAPTSTLNETDDRFHLLKPFLFTVSFILIVVTIGAIVLFKIRRNQQNIS